MRAARMLAIASILVACGPSGPSDEVRTAACSYLQTAADTEFANREIPAYDRATEGDFDDFVALGPERQARAEGQLQNVRTVQTNEPLQESAATTAAALEAQVAAGEALLQSPSEVTLGTLFDAFSAVQDAERSFLADLREHVPEPCD